MPLMVELEESLLANFTIEAMQFFVSPKSEFCALIPLVNRPQVKIEKSWSYDP